MTVRQWWENYWYHYKWHTLFGLLVAITLIVGVTQCALREHPDQTAVLYCDRVLDDATVTALKTALTERAADENGDGTALFDVYNVSYSSTAQGQANFANSQKIMALVGSGDYVLYIVDEYGYQRLMVEDNMELFVTADFLPDRNGTAWNWKGSRLQRQLDDLPLPEDLYFCIRKVAGTLAESEAAAARADAAQRLIRALMAEPVS